MTCGPIIKKPEDCRPLHTKWVYKTKTDANGNIERYKARLVACGNEQRFGVDYGLTFAAVMDMGTVKIILALARKWNVKAKHGDIPNTYVKALEEEHEIYLFIPKGMAISEQCLELNKVKFREELVLKLKKTLYGLKQAGRLWNRLLDNKLVELDFVQCYTDMCLYFKRDGVNTVIVGVYVDDLLVTGSHESLVTQFFKDMEVLEIKNLGEVSKFLGMRVTHDIENGYFLDQEIMIQSLLKTSVWLTLTVLEHRLEMN